MKLFVVIKQIIANNFPFQIIFQILLDFELKVLETIPI
jgi:hypothetical protein